MSLDMEALLDSIRHVESGGNRMAVSPKGAKGPYQFMDATAKEYGVDDPFDEDKARNGARKYMGVLLNRYNGDVNSALAAWNWGMGNLERQGPSKMPEETQNFQMRVMEQYSGRAGGAITVAGAEPPSPQPVGAVSLYPEPERAPRKQVSLYPDGSDRLQQTVLEGNAQPADRAARIFRMGQRTGLPESLIDRNLEEIESRTAKDDFDAEVFRKSSPLVAEWMAESKNKAALAKLDYDHLTTLESIFKAFAVIPEEAAEGWREDDLTTLAFGEVVGTATEQDRARRRELQKDLQADAKELQGLPSWTGAAAKVMGQQAKQGLESAEFGLKYGVPTGAATGALIGMAAGPVGAAAGAKAGAITGFRAGFGSKYAVGTYQRAVGEAFIALEEAKYPDGEPLDPTVAKAAALLVGVPHAGLDLFAFSKSIKLIPGAEKVIASMGIKQATKILTNPALKPALAEFGKRYAVAVGTETITEGLQELLVILTREIATGNYGPPTEEDRASIAGVMTQAFKASVVLAGAGAGPKIVELRADIKQAQRNVEMMETLGGIAKDSNMAQTSPEALNEITTKLAQSGTAKNVYIPVERWNEAFGDGAAAAQEVFGNKDQYTEATTHGGDIVVPIGLYTEKIARTNFHEALMQDVRLSPGDMTFREAQLAARNVEVLEEDLAVEADAVEQREAQLAPIYDDIFSKLSESGMGDISAHRNAMLWREVYNTRAERLGMNPLELYNEAPIASIQRQFPGGVATPGLDIAGLGQGERGFLDPTSNVIGMLKTADPSTFLHESGHFWLEQFRRDALRPNAPAQLIADWQMIKDWTGATDDAIPVDSHEMFARGIEAYAREGRSPSLTLRNVIAQFSQWLNRIYKSMKLLDVELTPEVRDVMDRMFATDEAITAMREYNGYDQTLLPPQHMTPQEFVQYQALNEQAKNEATEALRVAVMKQMKYETLDAYRKEKKRITKEVEAAFNEQPVWRLSSWLQRGKLPDGTEFPGLEHVRLSKDALIDLGVDLKTMPIMSYQKEGGAAPGALADYFGFPDGLSLVKALQNLPSKRSMIDDIVSRELSGQYKDAMADGTLMEMAALEVQSNRQEELFNMELRILKRLGAQQKQASPAVLKDLARSIIDRKTVRTLDPRTYEQAAIKAGNEAHAGMFGNDASAAFDAKQRQIFNMYLYREAARQKQDIDKQVEKWERNLFKRKDERLARTRDIELVNAARAVLSRHGIGAAPETAMDYLRKVAQYDPQTFADLHDIVEAATSDNRNWKDLTVSEFRLMEDAVQGLEHMSRTSRTIEIDGQRRERKEIVGKLNDQAATFISSKHRRAGYAKAVTGWEKSKISLSGVKAYLRRVLSWTRAMDAGNAEKPFERFIYTKITEASDRFREDKQQTLDKFLKILEPVQKRFTNETFDAPEIGYHFANRAELLGAIMHTGNQSSLEKLIVGRQWGAITPDGELDATQWNRFRERAEAEGILTKVDYDFVQAVWNLFEEIKPRAQATHKKVYGYYFDEITHKPFDTKFGEYKGGYFPAIVDPFIVEDAALRADLLAMEGRPTSYMWPKTVQGFTKNRQAQYRKPLALDLGLIQSHINQTLKFIHLEQHVKEVARLVNDKDFRSMLGQVDSEAATEMLIPWLDRSAKQAVEAAVPGRGIKRLNDFARFIRKTSALQLMAGNVVNTLQQFTGAASAAQLVKPRYLMGALWRFTRNPMIVAADIHEKSLFMRERANPMLAAIQGSIDEIVLNPNKLQKAKAFADRHGYFMQVATQNVMDFVAWGGAYEQGIISGLSEKEAIREADIAVKETQGSFAPEDISRFEAGTPFIRLFTMFSSYFNSMANVQVTEFGKAIREGGFGGASRALYIYVFGYMIPAVMAEAIMKAATGDLFDDDDDDGYLDNILGTFFMAQVKFGLAMVPAVGPVINAAINKFNDRWYDDKVSATPAIAMLESAAAVPHDLYRLGAEDEEVRGRTFARDVLTLLGLATGLPLRPLSKPVGYLLDVEQGYVEPEGATNFARGLITGYTGPQE